MGIPSRNLELISRRSAIATILMSYYRRDAHIASCLSVIDALVASFELIENFNGKVGKQIFLSKGHSAAAFYAVLAEFEYISKSELTTFNTSRSRLGNHPSRAQLSDNGFSSGSLGHGISLAAGVALGSRIRGEKLTSITILGDGETNEGSIWEGAMFASNHNLSNLIALIDHNKIQAVGRFEDIDSSGSLEKKFKSFGWDCETIPGNDASIIYKAMERHRGCPNTTKPLALILDSKAGARVSFMEDNILWHYRSPDHVEFASAMEELSASLIAADLLEIFSEA